MTRRLQSTKGHNQTELNLKQLWKEERANIANYRCARVAETYLNRLRLQLKQNVVKRNIDASEWFFLIFIDFNILHFILKGCKSHLYRADKQKLSSFLAVKQHNVIILLGVILCYIHCIYFSMYFMLVLYIDTIFKCTHFV